MYSIFNQGIGMVLISASILFLVGGKSTKQLVDRCISYIGENASECFKTNSFLNLSKDALVKLISSDCVSSSDLAR